MGFFVNEFHKRIKIDLGSKLKNSDHLVINLQD